MQMAELRYLSVMTWMNQQDMSVWHLISNAQCEKAYRGISDTYSRCYDVIQKLIPIVIESILCEAPASFCFLITTRFLVMKVMKHFFSQCSVSCGKGFKFRDVHCLDSFQAKIEEGNCRHLKKPRTYKICRAGRCPAWKASSWKEVCKICYNYVTMRVHANIVFMTPCFNGSIYQDIAIRSTNY